MEFIQLLKERHSIRSFEDRQVPENLVEEILEMANTSPSAGNLQARSVVIVKDLKIKNKLSRAAMGQESLVEAGVVFVVTANADESINRYGRRGQELYCIQDATIFSAYLQLAAVELGLASVWIGAFNEEEVRGVLGIKNSYRPIALIPVGYPAGSSRNTGRKNMDELIIKRL